MSTCKDFEDEIFLLDDLAPSSRKALEQHAEECLKCRKHIRDIEAIMAALRRGTTSRHIDDDLLTRYAVYLSEPDEPDYDGRQLSREEITNIKGHVDLCQSCGKKVDVLAGALQELDEFLSEAGVFRRDLL